MGMKALQKYSLIEIRGAHVRETPERWVKIPAVPCHPTSIDFVFSGSKKNPLDTQEKWEFCDIEHIDLEKIEIWT
jgi:hypothetical protein